MRFPPCLLVSAVEQLAGTLLEWMRADGEGGFDALRILKRSKPSGSLLELGCGSSRFAEAAAEMGYQPVLATDISEVHCYRSKIPRHCRLKPGKS